MKQSKIMTIYGFRKGYLGNYYLGFIHSNNPKETINDLANYCDYRIPSDHYHNFSFKNKRNPNASFLLQMMKDDHALSTFVLPYLDEDFHPLQQGKWKSYSNWSLDKMKWPHLDGGFKFDLVKRNFFRFSDYERRIFKMNSIVRENEE